MKEFEITDDMKAPKGLRLAHYFIDLLAAYALFFVLAFIYVIVAAFFGITPEEAVAAPDWKYNIAFLALYIAYCTAFETFGGRTLGKLITGTMVVTEFGEKADFGTIFRRNLCRLIPFDALSFLGENGWHDSISGTRVVRKHIYIIRKNEVIELDEIGEKSEIL